MASGKGKHSHLKVGDRVRIISVNAYDTAPPVGAEGRIDHFNDIGQPYFVPDGGLSPMYLFSAEAKVIGGSREW